MTSYSDQTNYLNSGWNTNATKITAYEIDHIASKSEFAIDMIQNALLGFDAIERELLDISSANVPPQPTILKSLSHRIDTNQKQVVDGLNKLKELMKEIDRATDILQQTNKSGWGY